MPTALTGTYILRASQVFFDGVTVQAPADVAPGQLFSWCGEPIRLDGPQSILPLGCTDVSDAVRKRAARSVQRRFDFTLSQDTQPSADPAIDAADDLDTLVVSDGHRQFMLQLMVSPQGNAPFFLCPAGLPLPNVELRVVSSTEADGTIVKRRADPGPDVICFTSGTRLLTPNGQVPVENLVVGDVVTTKDAGSQEIIWIGSRRMSGARLHAMPELRPVRLRRGALAGEVPDDDLIVSPMHRLIISGPRAEALFNQSEVLVPAQDLINDTSIFVDHAMREVSYVHILFADHQIVWANGVACESYHPANTSLSCVHPMQRQSLLDVVPCIDRDPYAYGPFARRNLQRSEVAILMSH